ncbi:MAG TPA: LamG domain-containing protein [Phaeodactylibacter sp.]|nr:LamG domain-containing protein [Phaeodactylibacter sp.]
MNKNHIIAILFLLVANISEGQYGRHLVAYYPFENGKAKDYTNRGGKGKIYGRLQIVDGVKGEALRFDGGNHNIVFKGKVNRYLRGKKDFTISFYFRSDDLAQRSSILGKRRRCDGHRMFDLRFANGKINAELYQKEYPQIKNNTRAIVPNTNWHHYVYVRRGNTVRLFVDGRLEDSGQIRRIIPIDDEAYFAINASPCKGINGTGNLRGSIDELKIFNVALTKKGVHHLFEKNIRQFNHDHHGKKRKHKKKKKEYRKKERHQRITQTDNDDATNFPKKNNTPTDSNLNAVFGKYTDGESKSSLVLDAKKFILTIKNPEGYQAETLIYTGKYKIEAGSLYLLKGEVVLKNQADEVTQKNDYKEKIIGEIYLNGVDLFAFETRMKLKK